MEDDIRDLANGYGVAAMHLQTAIMTTLVAKGFLTMKDCALICKGALQEMEGKRPVPQGQQMHELARMILTTLARNWDVQAKGN
jgi:hypothetical protein